MLGCEAEKETLPATPLTPASLRKSRRFMSAVPIRRLPTSDRRAKQMLRIPPGAAGVQTFPLPRPVVKGNMGRRACSAMQNKSLDRLWCQSIQKPRLTPKLPGQGGQDGQTGPRLEFHIVKHLCRRPLAAPAAACRCYAATFVRPSVQVPQGRRAAAPQCSGPHRCPASECQNRHR